MYIAAIVIFPLGAKRLILNSKTNSLSLGKYCLNLESCGQHAVTDGKLGHVKP